MKTENITYILARLPIGLSMFGHGLIRLTKLQVFTAFLGILGGHPAITRFVYSICHRAWRTDYACTDFWYRDAGTMEQYIYPDDLWRIFCLIVPVFRVQFLFPGQLAQKR